MADTKTVVLVHGAWHGSWCWHKVVDGLRDRGVPVVAVDLPLTSLHDDVDATTKALDEIDGPIVLCGHSYGGAVITEAGRHPAVEHLVYVTAFTVDEGESPSRAAPDSNAPATELNDAIVVSEDGAWLTLAHERLPNGLYHDCSEEDTAFALARLRPIAMSCVTTPAGVPAFRTTPSTYAVCTDDRAVHPELQRAMAARCTSVVEWPTAHSPFFNRPDLVVDLLAERAR